jgi:hypothetical protein
MVQYKQKGEFNIGKSPASHVLNYAYSNKTLSARFIWPDRPLKRKVKKCISDARKAYRLPYSNLIRRPLSKSKSLHCLPKPCLQVFFTISFFHLLPSLFILIYYLILLFFPFYFTLRSGPNPGGEWGGV